MAYVTAITCDPGESVDIELVGLVRSATGASVTWDSVAYSLANSAGTEVGTGTLTEDATTADTWRAECIAPVTEGAYTITVTVEVGSTTGIFKGTMRVKA